MNVLNNYVRNIMLKNVQYVDKQNGFIIMNKYIMLQKMKTVGEYYEFIILIIFISFINIYHIFILLIMFLFYLN